VPTLADLYPELYGTPGETLQQNKPGLATSFKGALGGFPVGVGRLLEDSGFEETGRDIREYGEGVQFRNPSSPASQSFEGFMESPWQGTKEIVGSALGYTLPALVPYVGPTARVLGGAGSAAAGTAIASVPAYGGIRETQDQTGAYDPGAALLGATATGAIEQIGGVQRLFRPGMQGLVGTTPRHLLQEFRSTPLRTGLSTANRVALGEAGEELAQNPIEQYAGGQDPWQAEQIHDTLFGGFAGYVGGLLPFGAGAGVNRAMQHVAARDFAAANPNTLDAFEINRQLQGTPEDVYRSQVADYIRQQIAEGMTMGTPVNLLQPHDVDTLERIGADNGQLFNQTINPYDVGGQVSALQQGQETDPFEQQFGLFGGGGAQPYTPSLSAPGGFAPLPTGQPMQAFPHQGEVMPQAQQVEPPVNRAASIMQAAARGANVLPTDRDWAEQTLRQSLTPTQYESFLASFRQQPKAQKAAAPTQQQKGQAAPAPTASPYEQLYKASGGIYSPAQKALAAAKTDEDALRVVRDVLENKKPSQKVMQALEEVHKKLSGQTMTQYLREKEAQEKQDPKKPGPVTIIKGDANAQANVPVQEVRQEAQAGQVPDEQVAREEIVAALTDANATRSEIENAMKGVDARGNYAKDALAGKMWIGGQFREVTQEDVDAYTEGKQRKDQERTKKLAALAAAEKKGDTSALYGIMPSDWGGSFIRPGESVFAAARRYLEEDRFHEHQLEKAKRQMARAAKAKGATDVVRQTPLPGPAPVAKAGAGSVSQVQAKARPENKGAQPEADRKQGQAQQVRWEDQEPEEVQNFVLQEAAKKVGVRKARILQVLTGWGTDPDPTFAERIPTYTELGEHMKIGKARVEQIWKEMSRSGGVVDQVLSEHGLELKHLRAKETTDEKPEGPAQPTSSLVARPADAAGAGIVDPDAEAGDVDRNTGFTTGDISKINSSNITGELSTAVDKKTGETTVGKEFTPDQEGQANERAAAFEEAVEAEDVEAQAILAWNAAVQHFGAQDEKIKPWDKIAEETKKTFLEKFTASLSEAKDNIRAAKQMGAFRRLVKQVYYSYGTSFEEKDLRHDGVQRALNELWDSGLYHILNFGEVHVSDDERMGTADGRAILRDDGTFTIILNKKMFAGIKSDKHISHVLRHELSHAIDAVGLYSSSGKFDVVMEETRKLYREGDHLSVWRDYLAYPYKSFQMFVDVKYPHLGNIIALKAEVFAQMQAMWMVPAGRTLIQRDAPQTADFLRKVQEHARRLLQDTIDKGAQGVPGAATGRGVAYGDTRAQSRVRQARPRVFDHRAFHGTPHEIDRFTTEKIGSGEGAQAYGWGLYFASNKAVATWYRDVLGTAKLEVTADHKYPAHERGKRVVLDHFSGGEREYDLAYRALMKHQGNVEQAITQVRSEGIRRAAMGLDDKVYDYAVDYLREWKARGVRYIPHGGRIYQVDLAPKENEYLDWDKPLHRQGDKVKLAISSPLFESFFADMQRSKPGTMTPWEWMTGEDFYEALVGTKGFTRLEPSLASALKGALGEELDTQYIPFDKRPKAASKLLLSLGVPGIKYLDQRSRGVGSGTHNFVIFDDSAINIVERESRGKSFEEAGLPEREAFKPQLHEGFTKALEEVAAAVRSGDRARERAARNKTIPIGRTPVVLRAITTITGEKVFRKSDFVIGNGATVYLKGQDEHQASAHGWAVPVETLKQLPQLLADPVAVFRSGERSSDSDSYKIVLDAEVAGKPVIAALKPNRPQQEFGGETAHFTVTVFPLRNGWSQVEQWNDLGLLRYYDDKRAPAGMPGTNPQGLTGTRGARPDFSVGVSKAPVKVATKTQIEQTPREFYSMGKSFEESPAYPAELKPSLSMVTSYAKDLVTDWAKKGLQSVVFAQDLVDIAVKEGLTTAKGFFDLLNAKAAKRTHLEALLDRIMTEAADIPDRTAASAFLRDSTRTQIWGYAPSWKPDAQVDPAMEAKYNRLSPEAKTIVDRVFKYGEDNYNELQRLVNKEINDEFDAQLTKAATADERDAIEKERGKRIRTVGRVLPKLQGPYAPLKRFGDYVSVGKSEAYLDAEAMGDTKAIEELQQDDRHYLVEFHDSFPAAKSRARQLQPYFAKTDGFEKQKIYRDVQELPFGAIAKVKQAIADMPEGTKHRAALSRLVTDLYLTMLSESSARKSELRRRYVHGEEQDMFRSFASQGRASAHFIAALEKNGEIQKHISKMQSEAAQGPGDRANKNRVFNEILGRYAQGLDYRPTPLTDKAMALTSFWMLVSTPSYYLQNATQPFILTLPVLSGRFGNGAAWAALTKAYKDVFRVYKHFGHDLVVDKLPVSDDEKAMLRQLRDTGRIDLTIAQDLGRWTEGEGVLQRGVVGKVMRKLWAAPHQVEMLNRITSALAAYRLSKGSLEYTARVVDQTHGNYAASNAPRFMHANSAMRLITQFRKFQLIQVSLLGRLLHDAFKNASAEERAVARAALGWILAHHMVMAGAIGLPLANVAGFVLAAAFGDDDEPKDFERMARKAIGDEDLANLILKGVPAAAGLDVSGRIGMGNAFALLPFTDIKLLDRKGFAETAMSAGGAFLGGILPNMAEGMGQMSKGDYYKGLELLLPRGVRDAMRAYRMATEGISQKNNDVVMKPSELSIFDVMSQAVGLPSTLLQARQRRVGDVIETQEYYNERTGLIKHQYAAAYKDNDVEEMQDLREEWAQVAAAMRRQGLKPQPLSSLLRAPRDQAKRERETVEGVQTKKSNREFVRQGAQL
jgi:hypothetical protein